MRRKVRPHTEIVAATWCEADARWQLRGSRGDIHTAGVLVSAIGTGASAIQVVPAIADRVAHLDLYQRTAPWIVPRRDPPYRPRRSWPATRRSRPSPRWPGATSSTMAYDAMLDADGHELLLWPLLNYGDGCYDGLLAMMEHPLTVQGLGDGGAHVGLVCDATMTTYMLAHRVRDRTRGRRLGLEHAVRRLTRDPAGSTGSPTGAWSRLAGGRTST